MIGALVLLSLGMPAQAGSTCPAEIIEPERRFSGIYVDDFEGQRFFEGAAGIGDLDFRARPIVNFEPDIVRVGERFGITQRANGLAYRVTFKGVMRSRGTVEPPAPLCGYGHFGGAGRRIDLTVVETIEPLGPVR